MRAVLEEEINFKKEKHLWLFWGFNVFSWFQQLMFWADIVNIFLDSQSHSSDAAKILGIYFRMFIWQYLAFSLSSFICFCSEFLVFHLWKEQSCLRMTLCVLPVTGPRRQLWTSYGCFSCVNEINFESNIFHGISKHKVKSNIYMLYLNLCWVCCKCLNNFEFP